MATRHAAEALGWRETLGSLEPGKAADVVLVPIDDWRFHQTTHPFYAFLLCGSSKDVDTVFVAGERVVESGRCVRFDEATLRRDYEQALAKVQARLFA